MSNTEAIRWLIAIEDKYIHGGDEGFDEKRKQAIKTAISALEKQIPKKPIKKNPICYAKSKSGKEFFAFNYFCPNCNKQIKANEHHCNCGQALDWGDSE